LFFPVGDPDLAAFRCHAHPTAAMAAAPTAPRRSQRVTPERGLADAGERSSR
jgi:hypothetical protein